MKRNVSSIFWGLLFILAGVALLANQMGWVNFSLVSTNTWVYIFAGLSLVFFISYFVNGLDKWGWLFPALIFAAISLTIWMSDRGNDRFLRGHADPAGHWPCPSTSGSPSTARPGACSSRPGS